MIQEENSQRREMHRNYDYDILVENGFESRK